MLFYTTHKARRRSCLLYEEPRFRQKGVYEKAQDDPSPFIDSDILKALPSIYRTIGAPPISLHTRLWISEIVYFGKCMSFAHAILIW